MSGVPRLSDGKLGAGTLRPGATAEVLFGEDERELLRLEDAGVPAEGTLRGRIGPGSSVGKGLTIGMGVNVGALPLKLSGRDGVGRENPSDGTLNEGTLKDGIPVVGSDMLILEVGIARDGNARDGIAREGMLNDGKPIVGSETLRLGDGMATDGTPTGGKLGVGTLSTLFVGILKIGRAVGVAGKLIIGRPKESTAGGVGGTMSMLGVGMKNGGGPVIVGISIEGKLSEGMDRSGMVAEGRLADPRLADGTVTEGTPADGNVSSPRLVVGVPNDG